MDSEAEREAFIGAIQASPSFKRAMPKLLEVNEPARDQFVRQIEKAGGLGPATATHRAAMLLKWRKTLLSPQTRLVKGTRPGMWRRIDIKNFRSIEQATVELAPFTIVVGPNSSGKSNFVDAFVFARDVARDADAALSTRGGIGGVRRWRPTRPTDVTVDVRVADRRSTLDTHYVRHLFKLHSLKAPEWEFSEEEIEVAHSGEAKARVHRKGTRVTGHPDFKDHPTRSSSVMVLAKQTKPFAATSSIRNVRIYRLNPEQMRHVQLASEETRLAENGSNIAGAIRAIKAEGQIDAIVEPMAKIVPGLLDIGATQVGRHLVLQFKQSQGGGDVAEFDATEMSEGALRALGIIVAAHQMCRMSS